MSSIKLLNPKAEVARASQTIQINMSGARGLQEVLSSNLGPKGTMKMLVSGSGDIKMTKDGNMLLQEMQIQHPTASLVARVVTAQDDITGDGTTSTVLLIGELLKQAELSLSEGLHPRIIADGFQLALKKSLEVLEKIKIPLGQQPYRDILVKIAQTSLCTKLDSDMVKLLSEIVVDAVLSIKPDNDSPVDLHMIEIAEMMHKSEFETKLIKGLVLDHGARHPDMKKYVQNAFILSCNVSLEFEKSEVNSGFFYKTAEERSKMFESERKFTDDRVRQIIALKNKVCQGDDKGFVVINQKGIDPYSLDLLAKAGIVGIRRAKRRNMERLMLCCGGHAMNSLDELSIECLGFAGLVYEHSIGEDKYTFIEETPKKGSVTILIRAPNKYKIKLIKDAVSDGLRAVKNALDDGFVLPGAGATEIAIHDALCEYKNSVEGKQQLGIQAFADALLVIPKTLAQNAGLDKIDIIVKLLSAHKKSKLPVGIDLNTGNPIDPVVFGIYDNVSVKMQMISGSTVLSSNLLLVDRLMRAGLTSLKGDKIPQ